MINTYGDIFYNHLQKCRSWQEAVGERVASHYGYKSVIDFGCGSGYYLNGAHKTGARVLGYEYSYEQCKPYIPEPIKDCVKYADLTQPIKNEKNEKYDLAMSLEVAEHLPENKADIFVGNIITSSDHVFFSAAIPGQGGTNHINEQPREYWIEKFKANKYTYSQERTGVIRNIYATLRQRSKFINVMKRNIMFFIKD